MKRKVLLAATVVAGVFASNGAMAADLGSYAPVPSFTWTGAYVGVQAGYAWQKSKFTPGGGFDLKFKPKGFMVGGYAGYNYQFEGSPLVVGVETDFNYVDADDRQNLFGGFVTTKTRTKWAGATRVRVGYAVGPRTLVYAAGGVAYAKREARVGIPLFGVSVRDKKTSVGWTIGGGVEHAFTDNLVARVEYRYTDYGKDKFNLGGLRVKSSQNKEHRIMAGLAWKF